jgi:hypothetical protein
MTPPRACGCPDFCPLVSYQEDCARCRVNSTRRHFWPARQIDLLSDLDFEEGGIRVVVTPLEILTLLGGFHFAERAIVTVLLAQVDAVSAIFLDVPRMIIVSVPIVVALVMMIVSAHCYRSDQSRASENQAQNQKAMHRITSLLGEARC